MVKKLLRQTAIIIDVKLIASVVRIRRAGHLKVYLLKIVTGQSEANNSHSSIEKQYPFYVEIL